MEREQFLQQYQSVRKPGQEQKMILDCFNMKQDIIGSLVYAHYNFKKESILLKKSPIMKILENGVKKYSKKQLPNTHNNKSAMIKKLITT